MSRLDAGLIQRSLAAAPRSRLDELEVFTSIASTNTHLLAQAAPQPGRFRVALADHQTSGRGRQNRRWLSPPGGGLCLSFAYTFADQPAQLPALTLAIGVGIVDALQSLQIEGISLKWPNDVVALEGKLGGVLTEVQAGGGAGVTVVTGIGLNIDLTDSIDLGGESEWAQQAVDLRTVHPEHPPREVIAAGLIGSLHVVMATFETQGFAAFADEWRQHDWLRDRNVTVDQGDQEVSGVALGVDADGALLVETDSGPVRMISGTVKVTGPDANRQ